MPRPIDPPSHLANELVTGGGYTTPGVLVPALLGRAGAQAGPASLGIRGSSPVEALPPEAELEAPSLPRDLPQWVKDAVSVSARARDLIVRLKPVVVRILSFWDHRSRAAIVAGRRVAIDTSGSYRME